MTEAELLSGDRSLFSESQPECKAVLDCLMQAWEQMNVKHLQQRKARFEAEGHDFTGMAWTDINAIILHPQHVKHIESTPQEKALRKARKEAFELITSVQAAYNRFQILDASETEHLSYLHADVEWVNTGVEKALEIDSTLKHPLAPIVKAWLIEQTAKPITSEYDRKHPGGILPHKSVASVRYPLVSSAGEAIAPSIEVPSAGQLLLPTLERKMYLPEYLPVQIVQGVDMTSRNGVLPYPMRFFFEVGMSLKPKERKGWYTKTLYDAAVDIGVVDPHSDKERKKYLRADAKQAISNALDMLAEIRILYESRAGGIGAWRPFYAQSTPTPNSEKAFPIRVRVELPPDDTRGVLVVKEIVRSLYPHLAELNAYLAACVIFNQHAISPLGNLIDPTEPDPNTPRLESGQYVNPRTGKPMFTARGKPITDLYHPEAFEPLKAYRVFRKEADNYPALETEEIMRAVFPHEPWEKDRRPQRWEKKARAAWKAITEKGFIRVDEKRDGSLQILPSDYHVRLHHEVMKSGKAQA